MIDDDDINQFVPSVLNPRALRKNGGDSTFLTQNSIVSRCSLSLRKNGATSRKQAVQVKDKENSQNQSNTLPIKPPPNKQATPAKPVLNCTAGSLGISAVDDLSGLGEDIFLNRQTVEGNCQNGDSDPFSFSDPVAEENNKESHPKNEYTRSVVTISSATELDETQLNKSSDSTVIICENYVEKKSTDVICESVNIDKPLVSLSFGLNECETVNISTDKVNIKKISVFHKNNHVLVDCDIIESLSISTDSVELSKGSMGSSIEENMADHKGNPLKRSAVSVNLEIKKKRLLTEHKDATAEDNKLLILKTDAIEKVTHVIVQPPNYKLVKRKISSTAKSVAKTVSRAPRENASVTTGETLKQAPITAFFKREPDAQRVVSHTASKSVRLCNNVTRDVVREMNRNLSVYSALKSDHVVRSQNKNSRNELNLSPRSTKLPIKHDVSPKRQMSGTEAHSACMQINRNNSGSCYSPVKKTGDCTNAPASSSKSRSKTVVKPIPHHKIVAGTHFAVDAFSYGDIPNVKNYFLTHFHSDHYSGLKKTFSKALFCSKITADLCMSRLGVNPKCIHVMKLDECIRVDNVEVVAVDANHCPGAVMLIFTLSNGRSILHTGDFRASPVMESYPIFWNKDIYSVYLDTTYCNPRYDFPTQDQSLDMALYLLRQKKIALEKVGKKFSSVLIVCGTYTIGKEKFFLGMARRVGCSVWACPEKDRVLQAVEGRSFSHAPSSSCQLHVVPMRDLTYEKLRLYLESLQGAFSEVVAFKPSGWENGKNSTLERDHVTIYGIPYSEHSSFSEMIRFVKFIKPKKVVPTVDISGGIKSVQKYFPCPLVCKEDAQPQSRMTDFSFSIQPRQPVPAVT